MLKSKHIIAVPPGETIHEQLVSRGMNQKEFAIRMNMSEKHISHLINGKVELTTNVALNLELVLGIPARFWNNLEAQYRENLARAQAEIDSEKEAEIVANFPYANMAKFNWVPATRVMTEKINALRAFFEVAKLSQLEELVIPGISYRTMGENFTSDYALAAWSQKAKLEARKITTSPINIQKLKSNIKDIRSLTTKEPNIFCEELRNILSSCGIAIIFLPHIGGSFLHGASFIDNNHIVLGLTVRGSAADKFWFSLFHEIAHIVNGDIYVNSKTDETQENLCDEFAKNILIPENDYQRLVNLGRFDEYSIVKFANSIGIDAGIVLGRLQKENYVQYSWYGHLRKHYAISTN